jgi:hypothetical protein
MAAAMIFLNAAEVFSRGLAAGDCRVKQPEIRQTTRSSKGGGI